MLQMIIVFMLGIVIGMGIMGAIIIKVWGDDYK